MASEVTLPVLGENIDEGEVTAVKVAPGAEVTEGQALIEVQAEKSTADVPAPSAGRVQEIRVKVGDKVKTGSVILLLDGAGNGKAPAAPPVPKETPPPPDKAPPAPETKAPAPSTAPQPEAKPTPAPPRETKAAPPPAAPSTSAPTLVPAGPATRRLARELGVELARVPGTAPGGRVTQEDVKAFVRALASGTAPVAGTGPAQAPPLPDFAKWGPVEARPLDNIRRKTAEQMALAWSLIPHVTQHDLADLTDLEGFRKQQEAKGDKLTVTAFALKAAAIALRQFPQFNASLDLAKNQLVLKQYYHIGVAVDTDRGLFVPVLRDVDKKSVFELARELVEVAEKARQKKLGLEEMRGGSFTITNLGSIGGTAFTPIINYPEVAILGLSRGRLTPVVKDGQILPRLMLPLSLSYDHRVIDGADAARFTRRIVDMLENPLVMLLHA